MITPVGMLSTKLKNEITKANPTGQYEFDLKNISVNGSKKGCHGFITDRMTGYIVYVITEPSCCLPGVMYRYARNTKDWTGGKNEWYTGNIKGFTETLVKELRNKFSHDWQQKAWSNGRS